MKYNLIIALFFASTITVWILPMSNSSVLVFTIILFLLFISISIWGALTVSSQLFVNTKCKLKSEKGLVSITFDDGPDPNNTPIILKILDEWKVKASFFVIGKKIETNQSLLKKIYNDGHLIGNHSYYHTGKFPLQKVKNIRIDISMTQQIIKMITDEDCKYFRPPFGVTNPLIAKAIKPFSYSVIGWSIRSLDTVKSKEDTLNRVIRNVKSGDIIILHDTTKDIDWILKGILKFLKDNNLKPVRVDYLDL